MEIHVHEHENRVHIIEVVGRLEAATVPDLRKQQEELLNNGVKMFIVDLSQTTFMDSAGLSALVTLLKQVRLVNGEVALVKPAEPAAFRILQLTRFDKVFNLVDTVTHGIHQF